MTYLGDTGQTASGSAGLGVDSYDPHWHSWPCATGKGSLGKLDLDGGGVGEKDSTLTILMFSTAWCGQSSWNPLQESPSCEAFRSSLPMLFRSSPVSSLPSLSLARIIVILWNQVVMFDQVPLFTDLLGALLVLATVIAITFEKQVDIIITIVRSSLSSLPSPSPSYYKYMYFSAHRAL